MGVYWPNRQKNNNTMCALHVCVNLSLCILNRMQSYTNVCCLNKTDSYVQTVIVYVFQPEQHQHHRYRRRRRNRRSTKIINEDKNNNEKRREKKNYISNPNSPRPFLLYLWMCFDLKPRCRMQLKPKSNSVVHLLPK